MPSKEATELRSLGDFIKWRCGECLLATLGDQVFLLRRGQVGNFGTLSMLGDSEVLQDSQIQVKVEFHAAASFSQKPRGREDRQASEEFLSQINGNSAVT
jgi:hypothetical protein